MERAKRHPARRIEKQVAALRTELAALETLISKESPAIAVNQETALRNILSKSSSKLKKSEVVVNLTGAQKGWHMSL